MTIVETGHPVVNGLTNAELSNWGDSVHTTFSTPEAAGFLVVADGFDSQAAGDVPYIIVRPEAFSAGVDAGAGERRLQVEFPAINPAGLTSARVTLYTVKGANDTLDTVFYSGTAEQDGAITPSDFEAPTREVQGVVMPVPAAPVGTTGTFTIDVLSALENLFDEATSPTVFTIQGRVDAQATGQGLQVVSDPLPTLAFATPPPIFIPPLEYTVLSLPSFGTLLDSNGEPVVVGQVLPSPDLTFVSGGTTGSTSFSYQVDQAGIIGTGEVVLVLVDTCAEDGRPPGCSPGGE